ncbi:hypothetical protein WT27_12885 [Burkholderia territorii]|uniref:Uncharacterized protein n=1 Tax=Burkholderia territorii TaxID=1503055 RepID=A0A106DQX7_9BURK|nr:hypothetical protein [Burkholderia territorii]KVV40820.1 hypothetical protein WT27_12885 [Burkholderia territorii]KVX33768.1 hypothetical protein WT31_08790 [Burkholderia territorii]
MATEMTTVGVLEHEGWLKELDAVEQQERARVQEVATAAEVWRRRWPSHCTACGGWGGSTTRQSHPYGSGSAIELIPDPCEAHERVEICHRCGQDGLAEDGDGPCAVCGWNYDDGLPQL